MVLVQPPSLNPCLKCVTVNFNPLRDGSTQSTLMKALTLSLALALLLLFSPAWAESKNGFDLSNASIPADQIRQGYPPREGIPTIDDPVFKSADDIDWLQPGDRVLGLSINGDVRA